MLQLWKVLELRIQAIKHDPRKKIVIWNNFINKNTLQYISGHFPIFQPYFWHCLLFPTPYAYPAKTNKKSHHKYYTRKKNVFTYNVFTETMSVNI